MGRMALRGYGGAGGAGGARVKQPPSGPARVGAGGLLAQPEAGRGRQQASAPVHRRTSRRTRCSAIEPGCARVGAHVQSVRPCAPLLSDALCGKAAHLTHLPTVASVKMQTAIIICRREADPPSFPRLGTRNAMMSFWTQAACRREPEIHMCGHLLTWRAQRPQHTLYLLALSPCPASDCKVSQDKHEFAKHLKPAKRRRDTTPPPQCRVAPCVGPAASAACIDSGSRLRLAELAP